VTAPTPAPPALREGLHAFFAGVPEALADPYPLYREARELAPVVDLGPMVILTRHADVKEALRRSGDLGNRALVEGSRVDAARAAMSGEALAAFDEVVAFFSHFPSRNDDDDHARLRRIAHRAFTPRRIGELEQAIRHTAAVLLERIAPATPVDAMEIAYHLPLVVVAKLLGVPESDIGMIHRWSLALGAATASMEPEPFLAARDALVEFRAYLAEMVERQRSDGASTDLVGILIGAEQDERLTEVELSALFVQLLFAGHETTTNLIGTGLRELLRNRNQWALLVADPGRAPDVVDELLRYVAPTQFVSRLARRDLTLAGADIAAGTTVLAVTAAAHRDPAVFPDPDRLDIERPERASHLGFGFGPHFCLGAALARLEAEILLAEVADRFPAATIAGDANRWTGGAMLRHLVELPVLLAPGPSEASCRQSVAA
jgi:cytochrome P450